MARNQPDQSFDYNLRLKDAGLIAASAAAQVGGSDKILTLGDAHWRATIVVDVTAIEVASGNENYKIKWQLSDSATFASGVIGGAMIELGDSSTLAGESADSAVGQYKFDVRNEVNGTLYTYGRLYTEVAGTIATGINYTAHATK